jgi:hypothetical protein
MYKSIGNSEEEDDDDDSMLEDRFKKIVKDIKKGAPLGTEKEYSVSRNSSNYFQMKPSTS